MQGVPNTELLEVKATADTPDLASRAANGLAALLIARAHTLASQYGTAANASFKKRADALNRAILRDRLEAAKLRRRADYLQGLEIVSAHARFTAVGRALFEGAQAYMAQPGQR